MDEELFPDDRQKVCLVDDDPDLLEIYSRELASDGFAVFTAGNGEEGLEIIRRERPEVILLDLQMPVKDGFDVLRELAADANISRIPVVILSNKDNDEAFREVGNFKAEFFLVKSLTTPKKVVGIVHEILAA